MRACRFQQRRCRIETIERRPRPFERLSKRLFIEPKIAGYDLRHTAISYQVEKGHPVHQIADWAGTSERMIWDVYRHKLNNITDLGPSDELQ